MRAKSFESQVEIVKSRWLKTDFSLSVFFLLYYSKKRGSNEQLKHLSGIFKHLRNGPIK